MVETAKPAQPTEAGATEIIRCVTFELGGESYAIDVMAVSEVLRAGEITPVPGAPHGVLGIINLRGNVVTVLDTRTRFGLPPKDRDDASRVIICERDDQVVGLLVDRVAEVIDLDIAEIEPTPSVGSGEGGEYIRGVVSNSSHLLIVVRHEHLIPSPGGAADLF